MIIDFRFDNENSSTYIIIYRNAGVDVTTQSREEYAAVYHFQNFDKNGDRVLERKEKKAAKRFLTRWEEREDCKVWKGREGKGGSQAESLSTARNPTLK